MSRHRQVYNDLRHEDYGDDYDDYDDDYYEEDDYDDTPKVAVAVKKKPAKPATTKAPAPAPKAKQPPQPKQQQQQQQQQQPQKQQASSAPPTASSSALPPGLTPSTKPPGLAPPPHASTTTSASAAAAPSAAAATATAAATPPPPLPPPPPSKQLNMVVIGHVDAGKSTLMGRLLVHAGRVEQRTMAKYERESQQAGKASFRYAWVMDQSEEERARGVTVDVGTAFFCSGAREVNVLDAPGHRDFVPNMIGGAAQADLALLVVNAAPGEFEAGLSGQTREHIVLARSLGAPRLLVAVNQMDAANWDRARYEDIQHRLTPLLAQVGFKSPPPAFVPLSALAGLNLAPGTRPDGGALDAWYKGRSLLEEIDEVTPTPRPSTVGTRLAVVDAFRPGVGGGGGGGGGGALTVTGTLQAGTLRAGQSLLLLPAREVVVAKALTSRGVAVDEVTAGDHAEVSLGATGSLDAQAVFAGSVLCDPQRPVALARQVEAQVRSMDRMVSRGQSVEFYVHTAATAATVRQVVALIDGKTGERVEAKRPPRAMPPRSTAVVLLDLEASVALECAADCKHLGRVVLRDGGETVAAGLVTAIHRKL